MNVSPALPRLQTALILLRCIRCQGMWGTTENMLYRGGQQFLVDDHGYQWPICHTCAAQVKAARKGDN